MMHHGAVEEECLLEPTPLSEYQEQQSSNKNSLLKLDQNLVPSLLALDESGDGAVSSSVGSSLRPNGIGGVDSGGIDRMEMNRRQPQNHSSITAAESTTSEAEKEDTLTTTVTTCPANKAAKFGLISPFASIIRCKPCNPTQGLTLGGKPITAEMLDDLTPDDLEENVLMMNGEPATTEQLADLLLTTLQQEDQFLLPPNMLANFFMMMENEDDYDDINTGLDETGFKKP